METTKCVSGGPSIFLLRRRDVDFLKHTLSETVKDCCIHTYSNGFLIYFQNHSSWINAELLLESEETFHQTFEKGKIFVCLIWILRLFDTFKVTHSGSFVQIALFLGYSSTLRIEHGTAGHPWTKICSRTLHLMVFGSACVIQVRDLYYSPLRRNWFGIGHCLK